MASTGTKEPSFVLDGRRYPLRSSRSAGAQLLERFARGVVLPGEDEPPYLFCGNGSCRDCNLLVEGFADVASCRIPMAPGMSVRSGEGAGEENVLARKIGPVPEGSAIGCDVAVVGAGPAGQSVARDFRAQGCSVEIFDARAPELRPAAVLDGRLVVFEDRSCRAVEAETIVLATGARDVYPSFPGSLLAGVMPMDLLERYVALQSLPGERILLVGGGERAVELETALRELGAREIARSEIPTSSEMGIVAVAGKRVPSLELAKALGCRTRYDRERGYDVLDVDDAGRTSVDGVHAVGGMVDP